MMAGPDDRSRLDALKEQLRGRLDERRREREEQTDVSERRLEFREAAAVLTSFDPATLQPVHGSAELSEAFAELVEDAVVVEKPPGRSRWTLLASIRRQALESLGTRQRMLQALEANPDRPKTTAQRILEDYIRGDPPSPDHQSLGQLQAALQAVRWLAGIIADLPDPRDLRRRLEVLRLYAPFEKLAGKHFGGRTKELQQLRDYVELLPPQRIRGALNRQLRRWAGLQARAPLVVYGPGGVGKSTLVAKLVLDHARPGNELRIPFAYLDFDDSKLVIEEPATLLIEALRQLAIQYPEQRGGCDELRHDLERELRQREASPLLAPLDATSDQPLNEQASELLADQRGWERWHLERFAGLVLQLPAPKTAEGSGRPPFLLVLDTFEEVQYRSAARVKQLWEWLANLQDLLPTVRTVVSGRAPVRDLKVKKRKAEELELKDLDTEAAVGFLVARGVEDKKLANAIVRQVRGNPLSLSLAAEVIRREGGLGADPRGGKFKRLSKVFFSVSEDEIQGILYRRILDHIKNQDVRKLAHPGLVLRRITPELIQQVLAGPCQIEVPDAKRAKELFDALKREVTLVNPSEDGSLRHRQDVRRLMLGPLRRDRPDQVQAIHKAAAAYYAGQLGDVARAERIYHGLQAGEQPDSLEPLWTPGVGELLRGAAEELSASGQVFLARHMEMPLAPDVVRQAELQDWEQYAARRCQELLQLGNTAAVPGVLAERRSRSPNSPLNLVEVVTLIASADWEQALVTANRALAEAEEAHDRQSVLRCSVALAHLADRSEALVDADELLERAGELADRLDDRVAVLGVRLQRLLLRRSVRGQELTKASATTGAELAEEAIAAFAGLPDLTLKDHPEMVRASMAELGAIDPKTLRRGLRLVGLGLVEDQDLVRMASAVVKVQSGALDSLGSTLAKTLEVPPTGSPPWHDVMVQAEAAGRLAEFLDRILDTAPDSQEIGEAVAEVVADHTSWSLYVSVYAAIAGLPTTGSAA
jgi:cellulose synthase operon protein C